MKRTTLITLGLSLAACSSSTSQPATPADYDDTAQAIAAMTATGGGGAGDVVAMADIMVITSGRLPVGFSRQGDGQIRGDHLGIEHSFTVTCKDAAGAVQEACDATTDAATAELTLSGSLETPRLTAAVDRRGTWTITGLQSATATFDGDSSFSVETSLQSSLRDGVTSSFSLDATASYDAIQIATADRQITGGSATFDVQARRVVTGTANGERDVDRSFEVHAELTFAADGTATLVIDGDQRFTLDLETGAVTRAR